ncbi:MAG TPA: hypothetical protein VNW29_05470 [Candidatus Sulfotelmatobacter sp.]|jgi:hypothetical protein|nr:hypothetical protein [Candidatus Sulfotelmatobacter sp.]
MPSLKAMISYGSFRIPHCFYSLPFYAVAGMSAQARADCNKFMTTKKKGGDNMNEITREQALDAFVGREIYACQSSLIEEALKQQLFSVDEIDNLYREFDGNLLSPAVCVKCHGEFPCLDSETGECEECYEANQMPQEIFEWWLISPWLGKKLQLIGEPIINNDYGIWWGRTTTGQAITMDYVIQKVYDDVMGYTV